MNAERRLYDDRVIVEFNPTAYNNEQLFLKYIEQHLIPALEGRPSLFALDVAEFHKTSIVLQNLQQHDIIPSLIPPGCTGLIQPLDVSINKPLKKRIRDITDEAIDQRPMEDVWTVRDRRVLTTKCVGQAWEDFCTQPQIVIDSFRHVGLFLLIDGSDDDKLNIKGLDSVEIGDWKWSENRPEAAPEAGSLLDSESIVIPVDSDESVAVEYFRPWEEF